MALICAGAQLRNSSAVSKINRLSLPRLQFLQFLRSLLQPELVFVFAQHMLNIPSGNTDTKLHTPNL